jgi:hypothetical protein
VEFQSSPSRAEVKPEIEHEGITCLTRDQFARMTAEIRPAESFKGVRLLFRSSLYSDFYLTEMKSVGSAYEAILPKPLPETDKVVYFMEAVTHDVSSVRSPTHEIRVVSKESECKDKATLATYFTGADPNIAVHAASQQAPAIPPGFQASGFADTGVTRGGLPATTMGILIGSGAGAATAGAPFSSRGDNPQNPSGSTSISTSSTSFSSTTTTQPQRRLLSHATETAPFRSALSHLSTGPCPRRRRRVWTHDETNGLDPHA